MSGGGTAKVLAKQRQVISTKMRIVDAVYDTEGELLYPYIIEALTEVLRDTVTLRNKHGKVVR